MIIGIVILSIIAVIAIMAVIGFFIEKSENKKAKINSQINIDEINSTPKVEAVNNDDVFAKPVLETEEIKENDNAATNANIPEVLDFNSISKELDDK